MMHSEVHVTLNGLKTSHSLMAALEVWLALSLGLPLLLLAWVYLYSRSLQIKKGTSEVPPGRFWQLPCFGETIQLLRGSPDDFLLLNSKYGRTFRSHLFGSPCICTTTVEAAKFLLNSPALFKSKYSKSLEAILGTESITQVQGELHSRYRRLIRAPIMSDALKKFTSDVDRLVREFCHGWGDNATISVQHELEKFCFEVPLLFACDSFKLHPDREKFFLHVRELEAGMLVLPINLPGTAYNRALKARKKALKFLRQLIDQRRQENGSVVHVDLLNSFLNDGDENGTKLSDIQVAENIMTVLFGGHETTVKLITWALHLLLLYPNILEKVKAENDALARERKHIDDSLTADDLQKLPFSLQVVQETLRIANVAGFIFREATQDVSFNGILFPKGWKVLAWSRTVHLDPEIYPGPLKFDPSRFQTQPKSNTFIPFGIGTRACPGGELAKLEALVFVHRIFEPAGTLSLEISYWPLPCPKDGLPLKLTRRQHLTSQLISLRSCQVKVGKGVVEQ